MTRLDEIKDQVKTLYGDRFWRRCESKELAGRLGSRRFCTGRAQTPVGPVAINFVAVHRQLQQVKDMTLLPPLAIAAAWFARETDSIPSGSTSS